MTSIVFVKYDKLASIKWLLFNSEFILNQFNSDKMCAEMKKIVIISYILKSIYICKLPLFIYRVIIVSIIIRMIRQFYKILIVEILIILSTRHFSDITVQQFFTIATEAITINDSK